jgi:integrase
MTTRAAKHPTGIRPIPQGWQAYVRINGKIRSKHFPPATSLTTMKRWREDQRVRARLGAELPPAGATLREDVQTYLRQVQTMPTLRDRRDDLIRWLHVFGPERIRKSITAGEIRAQLERWRLEGYAANTVNHRRTALMHLWSVLDGKTAQNPARDTPRYQDDSQHAPPRALSYEAIAALLDAMSESVTRARLELMAWTGWPPAQIAKLTPADIRWDDAVFIQARRKGKGAAGVWLPLLPQAWTALREYKRLGAWGKYSTSSARKSLRVAAKRARRALCAQVKAGTLDRPTAKARRRELLDVTPYQLRHSFLTLVARITQDDRAVMVLAQHADIRQTHRYTEATADPRAASALQEVAKQLRSSTGAQDH